MLHHQNRGLHYVPSPFQHIIIVTPHQWVYPVPIAFGKVLDDSVLSHYFPSPLFPVRCKHHNLKNVSVLQTKTFYGSQISNIVNIMCLNFNNLIDLELDNALIQFDGV